MQTVRLGKTELVVSKNGFGALPIQRISQADAVYLLQKAFDSGINYYDTARWYTDSEEKMGIALAHVRDKIIISTKTGATEATQFWSDLETSLTNLKTDYIDIYQFHNPAFCPKPGDESGVYECMLEAKEKGMKASIKMLVPMLLFIFPVVFIILMGPTVLNIIENF